MLRVVAKAHDLSFDERLALLVEREVLHRENRDSPPEVFQRHVGAWSEYYHPGVVVRDADRVGLPEPVDRAIGSGTGSTFPEDLRSTGQTHFLVQFFVKGRDRLGLVVEEMVAADLLDEA